MEELFVLFKRLAIKGLKILIFISLDCCLGNELKVANPDNIENSRLFLHILHRQQPIFNIVTVEIWLQHFRLGC